MNQASPGTLRFGVARPTAHVTNQSTVGLASRPQPLVSHTSRELLQNVKEDDESERRRSWGIRTLGRGSSSQLDYNQATDSVSKHYMKMGILINDDSRSVVSQSYTTESKPSIPDAMRRTQTLSPTSCSVNGEGTVLDIVPEGACPVTRPRTNSSGFELVDLEGGAESQPSPPISVKSSSSSSNTVHGGDELQPSSPDSGYGNTPEYINGARTEGRTEPRERGGTENSVSSVDSSGGSPRPSLRHTHSDLTTLSEQLSGPEVALERGASVQFPMSMAPSVSVLDFTEFKRQLQKQAQHHVDRSLPIPRQKVKGPTSDSAEWMQVESRSKKGRARSQPLSSAIVAQTGRGGKAGTLPSPASDKDYFQVSDELSKENSHFALSEALLSVIEQYKANCMEQNMEEQATPLSSPVLPSNPLVLSPSGLTPLDGEDYLSKSADGGDETTAMDTVSLTSLSEGATHTPQRPLQLGLLQLMQSPSWDNSAESTAQKLLRHMTGHMTRTGGDAQVVVQLPTELLTSLQNDEDLQRSVTTSSAHIRGNQEWAPPRKQIIYSMKQPSKNFQKDLATQGHRCTGCGMKVSATYAKYFRFCNYTGKYFCQNCHTNAVSIIPAHILDRWSFKKLPVSNFARDLLSKIHNDAVFTVTNKTLYNKVSAMAQAKELRAQLISVKQYLHTCRSNQAINLNLSFQGFAPWTTDLHTYSINDFLELKSGVKMKHLRAMLVDGVSHIKGCPLCMGKGFLCELCKDKNIIFPFETSIVSICQECQCCFHKACFPSSTPCPRCKRMNQRLRSRAQLEESKPRKDSRYSSKPS